jgi:ketosteroid isomerase-like protein
MAHQGTPQEVTFEFLDAFADAWNRHDVDAIMSAMTDDCVFEASSGLGIKGTIYDGQRQVEKELRRYSLNSPMPHGTGPSTSSQETEG